MGRYDAWRGYDGRGGWHRGRSPSRGYGEPPHRHPDRYGEAYFRGGRWAYGDGAIREAVRWSLFEDTWLDARNIEVEVIDGIVTLSGEAKDYLAARFAWDDAWETEGVRGVVSRLEVRRAAPSA